jgi:4-hydroxy-2-oxoglutarate aldolase
MPRTRSLTGIIAPVVSTFGAGGESLDVAGFEANIRAHLDAGLDGVVVNGSTGEAPLLDESERLTLVEAARAIVPDDRWLLVGVGAESTRLTVGRARSAAAAGADAVLVVAPHYFPNVAAPAALIAHYSRVADESPLPVLLYNIPKYTHFALPASVVHQLAQHANIVGLKDSAGDPIALAAYLEAQSPEFAVLTGHGATLARALTAGVRGGVLAIALFAPMLVLSLVEAVREGRQADAAATQARLVPLARDIVGTLGPAGIKAALEVMGLIGGPVRSPLPPLSATERQQVAGIVGAAMLLGRTDGSRAPVAARR